MLKKTGRLATVILGLALLTGCVIRITPPPTPTLPAIQFPPTVTTAPPATIATGLLPTNTISAPVTRSALQTAGDPYADRVASFKPGNPASTRFNNPQATLGAPDFSEATLSGFLTLGVGGSITVEFVDNIAVDGSGPDIEIYGDPNDDEMWIAEVSADCVNFKSFGKVRERAKLDLATAGLTSARCMRLTDDGDPSGGNSPGAELDAVVALNSAPPGQLAITSPAPTVGAKSAASDVPIGIIYPLTDGWVKEWAEEALPIIEIAEADVNALPEAISAGVRFRFLVRSSKTSAEGALAAAKELVEREGVRAIVGMPYSFELRGALDYLVANRIAAISSGSSSPNEILRKPDTVFRVGAQELYLARTFARFCMQQGYRKAAVIYRTDGWGDLYASEFAAQFKSQGFPIALVPIAPTHPQVKDYAPEVAQLSAKAAQLGADDQMVVLMAVWEGEDLNIMHHAAQDRALSRVRWLSAVLYPSLLSGRFEPSKIDFPDARDFAAARKLWGQELHPEINSLVRRLFDQTKQKLGRQPRFEHIYLYDAMQLAARAILLAGSKDGEAIARAIPVVATSYNPATGIIRFDQNGDAEANNLAYYGLFRGDKGWEYRYHAFYDAAKNQFRVLSSPEPRTVLFCPEC